MIVTPVGAPAQSQAPSKTESTRERAISAFLNPQAAKAGAQQQELPVDPNNITPDALQQLTSSQSVNNESPSEVTPPTSEPKAPSPKEDPALSSRYAALARREKALRAQAMQQDQLLKAREEALKAREVALAPPPQPAFDASKYVSLDDLTKDPFAHLAKAGLTYEQLVEQAMNAPKPDEVRLNNTVSQLQAQIADLQKKLEGTDKKFSEQEAASRAGAVNQIRYDVTSIVNRDPAFETIKVTGQQEEVVNLITKVYDEGMGDEYPKGTVLDYYEAAKMVEEEIAEYLYNTASKASKVASRFKPQQQVAPAAPAPKTPEQKPASNQVQMRTLTNQMTSSRQLSARDRAILAAQGKLSK